MAKLGLSNRADELKSRLKAKHSGAAGSATLPSLSRAKLFQQIGEPGERFEDIGEYVTFEDPTNPTEIARQSDTRYADLGNIQGEFAQTPSARNSIVRTSRESPDAPTPEEKRAYRGQMDSLSGEVDHIIPLWLGGSNKPQNLRVIPYEQHRNVVTRVQKAVEYLYRNPALAEKYFGRKLSLAEARNYAINAPSAHKDAFKGLEFNPRYGDVKGKNLEDQVKKSAQILSRFTQDPEDIGILDALKPSNLSAAGDKIPVIRELRPKNFRKTGERAGEWLGEKMPDTAAGEFAKGLVSGLTLGHITYAEENPDMSAKDQLGGMVGSIVGGLASMLVGGIVLKGAMTAMGASAAAAGAAGTGAKLSKGKRFFDAIKRINPNIVRGIEKFVKPKAQAIDVKSKGGILSNIFKRKATKAAEGAGGLKDSFGILEALKPTFKQGYKKRFLEDAAIFGTLGQLSRQEDQELSTRAKRLATDLAYGGLTAAVPGGLSRKLATVWMGAGLIDTIAGASPGEAATNATIMTLFHGLGGFRNSGLSNKAIDEYATDVASKTRNKWLTKIGIDATVPEGEIPRDDGGLYVKLKELKDTIEREDAEIIDLIKNEGLPRHQAEREVAAIKLSGRQLYTKAMPEDMRGLQAFEDMQSMAKRLKEESDSISQFYKKGDAMSRASSNLEPIPDDAPAKVIFTTSGVRGEMSESTMQDFAKAFRDENFNVSGNKAIPKGNSEAFLVKLPDLEARSVESPNPATFKETPTVHSQNVYNLQLRGHDGRLYDLGIVNESSAQKMFGDLRKDNIEHIEAKVDYITLVDGKVEVQGSIPDKALERVREFNAHVDGEAEGFKTRKDPIVREEVAEAKPEKAVEAKPEEVRPAEPKVEAEVSAVEQEAPTPTKYSKVRQMSDKQSTLEDIMEVKQPVKEGGQFSFPEKQTTSDKTRAEMGAKFSEADVNRVFNLGIISEGSTPKGMEVVMGDKKLMTAIRETAVALQKEGLSSEKRGRLIKQANRFKDELINHREINLGELEILGREILKSKYKVEKRVDPTIKSLVKDKVAAGMDKDKAMEEAIEDKIAHELMGTPLKEVKEAPTENQLKVADRIGKIKEQKLKEVESVEGQAGVEVESVEMEARQPAESPIDTPFMESPSRIKARAEGKIVKVDGPKTTSLKPKGREKLPKDVTGATEEQQKVIARSRQLIDNAIEDTDRPKNESPKEFAERMMQVIYEKELGIRRGQSVFRSRKIDVEKEVEGVKKFESPFMKGKPSGAYAGAGKVLNRKQLDELEEYAEMAVKRKTEQIKIDEPVGEGPVEAGSKERFYNPEFVNKLIDGGDVEEVKIYNKLIKALEEDKIDGENNEFFDALKAYRENDQSIIMKNNTLRYLKEFSDVADDADDAFELLVASKDISESEVNREQFIKAMVDTENADLSEIPEHILKLEPVKNKIMELDPTVESRIDDLIAGDPARNVPGLERNEATIKALKEARNRDELDIETMNRANAEFDAEVSEGKIRDVGDNRENYLKTYFFADAEGIRADIARLDSIKRRLKKDVDTGSDISSLSILKKERTVKEEGLEPMYGLSKETIERGKRGWEADEGSGDPIFSFENEKGEKRPVKNPVSIIINEASRTADDSIEKSFWSLVDEEAGKIGKLNKKRGRTDFREWKTGLRGNDLAMIFDSSRKGSSGMNRVVKMTDTQKAAYSIFNNTDFISVDVSKYPDADVADNLRELQDIVFRRMDENNKLIAEAGLTGSKEMKKSSKDWLTVWTRPEEALNPLEINVTNLSLAVERMKTPFGRELKRLARNDDELRAVEDYLGTSSDTFLAKYPHLERYALENDMAEMHRVSLEHARAKERGEIGGKKSETPQEQKLLDEMEESPGFDETYGDVTDENFIPRKEYAVSDIQINSLSDPFVRDYLKNLPEDKRQEAMRKNARLVASQIVESTEDAIRTSEYMKGKRFEGIKKKAEELREAKEERKKILAKSAESEGAGDFDNELFEVKKRISQLENRPYRMKGKDNPRYQRLKDRVEQGGGESNVFTKKFIDDKKRELEMTKAKLPDLKKDVQETQAMGDLSENAAYTLAKEKLSEANNKITEIENMIGTARELPEGNTPGDKIGLGDTVILESNGKKETYRILSDLEAKETKNSISISSPLGKNLTNKKIGDEVKVVISKKTEKSKTVTTKYKIISKDQNKTNIDKISESRNNIKKLEEKKARKKSPAYARKDKETAYNDLMEMSNEELNNLRVKPVYQLMYKYATDDEFAAYMSRGSDKGIGIPTFEELLKRKANKK